jgi:prepilin-type N-terminal cleavage/methylation domain-containing protein/prepilin-type processing-associated H-X9-DG protein
MHPTPHLRHERRAPWHPGRPFGFTLVELLVVIGIIALLISILLPALRRSREQARTVACLSKIRTLVQMCQMYANENKGSLPPIGLTVNSTNGSYARPSVIARGGEGYFDAYFNRMPGGITIDDNKDFATCPVFENNVVEQGGTSSKASSYRYNYVLGGHDARRWKLISGTTYYCNPWKLQEVRQSSMYALIMDGDYQDGSKAVSYNIVGFTNEWRSATVGGKHFHFPTFPRTLIHNIRGAGPVSGQMNVGFVDGSARSVSIDGYVFPVSGQPIPRPWAGDVYFDPYNPTDSW